MPNTSDQREKGWPEGLYIRGRSYRYRRRVKGQIRPFIEVWGTIPFDEAKRKTMRYNMDIADGKNPCKEKAKYGTTLKDFAVGTWLPKKKGELATRSFARYRAVVDNFLRFLADERKMGACLLSDIDYAVADDFKTHRQTTPIAPNGRKHLRQLKDGAAKKTVYFEVSTLRQLFSEAVTRRLIEANPFADVKTEKPKLREIAAKHHPLSRPEEKALLAAALVWDERTRSDSDVKFHDIVLFLVKTGLRSDELCHLEWTDIDWRKGVITVQEKTVNETRMIPVPALAMPHIKRLSSGKLPEELLLPNGDELTRRRVHLGIRKKEDLATIKVGDVDWDGCFIKTTQTYTWKPKGSSGDVPMCQTIHELLTHLQARRYGNFVFPHHDGGRCRLKLLDILKKVQKMAGIEGRLRIHDLRHTTAVRLREKGTPLETIMGIMRHADIRETLIYAPYDLTEGKKAVMALDD
jgi:integrase